MKPPSPKKQNEQVMAWNEKYPVGTPVTVRHDDGTLSETRTCSQAWLLGGHSAVILVDGIAGGYALHRISPSQQKPTTKEK